LFCFYFVFAFSIVASVKTPHNIENTTNPRRQKKPGYFAKVVLGLWPEASYLNYIATQTLMWVRVPT